MKRHSILLLLPLCLFFAASKGQDEPALPTLPENFWTTIEVNIINKNYTTRRNEFYDYQNDRVRFDVYTQDSEYVEIYEVDKNLQYEILNFQTCQVRTIDGNMSRLIDSNHHLMNTSALFRFGASYNETYDGVFSVRGIWCNRWSSIINDTREDGTWSAYTLYYYFSEPSWEIDEGNHPEFEVPIRAEIEGESFSNGTTSPFHHIYEFVFFQIGIPPSWYFDFPEQFRCGSVMDHPLPELPNQFSTIVELNVVNKNYTSIIKEYYDYDNDRARYEFYRRGHSYVEIILPESGYSYQVTDGTNCVIRTLNSSSPFGDQTSHLRSVSQLFEFGSEYNETYEGIREVRGISCDYWISDIVEHDNRTGSIMNYTLGWYFSVDTWDSRSKGQHNHRIPIRAEINGITISNGTSHPFYHVYEFIDFVPGAPDEDLFEHPGDVICRGPVGLALPVFPDTYSATVEFTDLNNNLTGVFNEYYDYESDRARYDYFYEDSSHIILVLPEKNMTYSISHGTYEHDNDTTCQIHTGELSTLLPASDLWEFSSKYNETYQGTTTVRGIPCDFWSHKIDRTDGNVTFHLDVLYYFSIDSWEMRGAHTEHRVPVQFKAKGNMTEGTKVTQLNLIYSFVNFDPLYIPPNVFDLQPQWNCGAHEYLTYVGFLLDIPLKDFNSYTFTSGLEAMFNLTEEHVYIISASGNTTVWVEFTAGNQTELDSINKAIKEMELADSPYKIISYSQTSTLDCPDGCGNGYCHFGTCVCDDDFTGSTCDKEVSNSKGLSAGGVVGILILGLFVGAAIGAFLVYVYLRRKIKDKMSRNMVALDDRDENDQIPLEQ